MFTEPVAETNGIRVSSANFWPTVLRSPISSVKIAGSAPVSRQTRSQIFVTAMAVSGVFSEGFQIVASPQTAASATFHDQTATGKLNAVITAMTPSGCHCSISRWLGRSDWIVMPYNMRDWPTAIIGALGGRALPKLFSLPAIFPHCIDRLVDHLRGDIERRPKPN